MLVNNTNAAYAVWPPCSSTNLAVPLNSGDGIYKVLVGRRGLSADSHQTSLGTELTLNHVAPTLTVTLPAAGTVAVPMIQLQGHGRPRQAG